MSGSGRIEGTEIGDFTFLIPLLPIFFFVNCAFEKLTSQSKEGKKISFHSILIKGLFLTEKTPMSVFLGGAKTTIMN